MSTWYIFFSYGTLFYSILPVTFLLFYSKKIKEIQTGVLNFEQNIFCVSKAVIEHVWTY